MNPSPRKTKSHGSASSPEEHTFVALAFSGFQVIKGLHTPGGGFLSQALQHVNEKLAPSDN